MARLDWFKKQTINAGIDRCVLYSDLEIGVAWSGIISVTEKGTSNERQQRYYDGQPIPGVQGLDQFEATIEAYTFPDEFLKHDGESKRTSREYSLSYRAGKDIHLVYNVITTPSEELYSTINDASSASTFSWDIYTFPVLVEGAAVSAHFVIDTETAWPAAVSEMEDVLYGTDTTVARLPLPDELMAIFERNAVLRIIDNGDGTWEAIGPDSMIRLLNPTTFEIDSTSAIFISEDTFKISSL